MIDGLAQRYGCLPSQILREPVWVLRMVRTVTLANPTPEMPEMPNMPGGW